MLYHVTCHKSISDRRIYTAFGCLKIYKNMFSIYQFKEVVRRYFSSMGRGTKIRFERRLDTL